MKLTLNRREPYRILEETVEYAVAYGWRRAHKHTETPTEEAILQEIEAAVMNGILERFDVRK